jgi:hypothetical protein
MIRKLTEREELISYICDAHKDARGFRPRYINFDSMTIAQLDLMANEMSIEVGETIARDNARRAMSETNFETLIIEMIGYGAACRKTAIRWLADAFEDNDPSYICYMLDIGYAYEKEIESAMVA